MPRAFLVKKKAKLEPGISRDADEHEYHWKIDRDETNEEAMVKEKNGTLYETDIASDRCATEEDILTKDTNSAKPKTLPCLTIPKPFHNHSTNVLRSMLYKGPSSPKNGKPATAAETHIVNPSRTAPPASLTASAHSAFDKVIPGDISARTKSCLRISPTLAHQHNTSVRFPHLSHVQLEKLREQSVRGQESKDAALPNSFGQRGEDALRAAGLVNLRPTETVIPQTITSQQISDEPLDLKIKRKEEEISRPHSAKSSTNSRDSVSPGDAEHVPINQYLLDRHNDRFDRSDSQSLINNAVFALRTPRYTPTVSSLSPVIPQNHINWAYAAYYQQAQFGGAYGYYYPRESRYPAIPPNNIPMLHRSFRSFNTTPMRTSHKTDIPDIHPDIKPSLSDNSSTKSTLEETEDELELPPSDNQDSGEPPVPKPQYREYLAQHLKTIRSNIFHHQQPAAAARPVARQPVLGLEYIQNETDVKVEEDMEDDSTDMFNSDKEQEQGNDRLLEMDDGDNGQEKQELQLQFNDNVTNATHVSGMDDRQKLNVPSLPTPNVKTPQPKKYKCDICFKGFSRSNTLVTHKRIHTGDKPFKCEMCGRAFRQPGNLTRHRLTHTTVKPYVCPQCDKAFNRASNLHTHMRTHTNYKPFTCPYCGKGFHQKIDMKIHSYTHTGEKPHKCKTCGRGFKQLTHLTYHMRTHSVVKMYTCVYCGKGFNQKGNLQAHIYGHTGERPYRCEVCDKGFTLASTLNTHRRTHAEKKPFQCQYCQKDFYQKNALKSHLIASHPYTGESLL